MTTTRPESIAAALFALTAAGWSVTFCDEHAWHSMRVTFVHAARDVRREVSIRRMELVSAVSTEAILLHAMIETLETTPC